MPRVILTECERYDFAHSLIVRATDINYAGHLGNEALLGLIHEARSHLMKALGFDTVLSGPEQIGLIIADLAVNFRAEAYAHQELVIDSQIGEIGEKSFRLFHRVRREKQIIALVETGLVAYDYQSGKVVALPGQFVNKLYRNQASSL